MSRPGEYGLEAHASVRAHFPNWPGDSRSPTVSRTSGSSVCRALHPLLPPSAAPASLARHCHAERGGQRLSIGCEPHPATYQGRGEGKPWGGTKVRFSLDRQSGWYDLTITVEGDAGFKQQVADHVETGDDSVTDPLLGLG